TVRYVVHETVVSCPGCRQEVAASAAQKSGRANLCPTCSTKLRFNRESMTRTRVVEVLRGKSVLKDASEIETQERLAETPIANVDVDPYDKPFVENRRTLTYAGMTTSDLFTPRNMSALALIAAAIDEAGDERVQSALRLVLTSGAASSSRLIAYRAGMTGGGPAWSVPGFWVPPTHLESNPLGHLKARVAKFERALDAMSGSGRIQAPGRVVNEDARTALKNLHSSGRKADLVFLDPPYGDSVPYLEFGAMWNAFLGQDVSPRDDISVSNRTTDNGGWGAYVDGLNSVIASVEDILAPQGRILLTFNNNDQRAWNALLGALQSSGFACVDVAYQFPAVVPAKAQFSPSSSYVGDLYSVWERSIAAPVAVDTVRSELHAALRRCASARGGLIAENLARRAAMVEVVKSNADASDVSKVDVWLEEWFTETDGFLRWNGDLDTSVLPVAEQVVATAEQLLTSKPRIAWTQLIEQVAETCADIGVPDIGEIGAILREKFEVDRLWVSRRHVQESFDL
ncbi:MAG: hypothetical protein ACRDWY_08985, partial [Actinomycetes bacterium]